jgi:hypothetical protein
MPIEYFGKTIEMLPKLRQACEEVGRDPVEVKVSVMLPFVDPSSLDRYAEHGICRLVLPLPSAGPEEVLPALDEFEPLIRRYSG